MFLDTLFIAYTLALYTHIHKKYRVFEQSTGVVFIFADLWEPSLQNQLAV